MLTLVGKTIAGIKIYSSLIKKEKSHVYSEKPVNTNIAKSLKFTSTRRHPTHSIASHDA